MLKTAFIIRGFTLNTSAADADFAELRAMVAAQGYSVVPVAITWNHKTISQFVKQFADIYHQEKTEYNVVIGGSFGAMAAFVAAPIIHPNRLILCSLSGLFKEDINTTDLARMKRLNAWLGKRRVADCLALSAEDTAQKVDRLSIPTALFYGEKEKLLYPRLVSRVKSTAKALRQHELIEVPNAGHQMRHTLYAREIVKKL